MECQMNVGEKLCLDDGKLYHWIVAGEIFESATICEDHAEKQHAYAAREDTDYGPVELCKGDGCQLC